MFIAFELVIHHHPLTKQLARDNLLVPAVHPLDTCGPPGRDLPTTFWPKFKYARHEHHEAIPIGIPRFPPNSSCLMLFNHVSRVFPPRSLLAFLRFQDGLGSAFTAAPSQPGQPGELCRRLAKRPAAQAVQAHRSKRRCRSAMVKVKGG